VCEYRPMLPQTTYVYSEEGDGAQAKEGNPEDANRVGRMISCAELGVRERCEVMSMFLRGAEQRCNVYMFCPYA